MIKLVATCAFGIESVLADEVKRLGYTIIATNNGYVEYEAELDGICRSNLWLRTAERVFLKATEFKAITFEELFQGVRKIQWDNYLEADSAIHVSGKSVKSALFSISDCQAISKKAIVDKMRSITGIDWLPETGYRVPVMISILKDQVMVLLDTSGEGLHKRGYRAKGNEAPLKETMAAAMVQLTRWRGDKPFVDPFCGSGTILIEAALYGKNIAPGLNRKFISETWTWIDAALWKSARTDAFRQIRQDVDIQLYGYDRNPASIRVARNNAVEAGVDDCIDFQVGNFGEQKLPSETGVVVTNPPYGERMGEEKEIRDLYTRMGKYFKPYECWSTYILTSHEEFEKLFGRVSDKNRKVYNGRIKCYYYQYFGKRFKVKTEQEL